MPSFKPEQWPLIPSYLEFGTLIDQYGGRTVEAYKGEELFDVLEGDNEICWNTYTSRKAASFSLVQEGFRAVFHELGVVVKYDSAGNLKDVRVEVSTLLDELLENNINSNDGELDKLFGLSDILFECKKEFVAQLDLTNGQYSICGVNEQNGENNILAVDKKDSFEIPAMLRVTIDNCYSFCIAFQKFEDNFRVGIGVIEEDTEPSPVGNLSTDVEENNLNISFLVVFLANDCNYMTYLDSNNANRFERLARRIIIG